MFPILLGFLLLVIIQEVITEKNCVYLGKNNAKFCGVTKFWQPRSWVVDGNYAFTKIVILPTAGALLVYIIGLLYCAKKFRVIYRKFVYVIETVPMDTDIFGFVQNSIFSRFLSENKNKKISFILFWFGLPMLKMLYDVIDVGLDAYYFWSIENIDGSMVSDKIYRNVDVNNAIYVFALFGAAKSILIIWLCNTIMNKLEKELSGLQSGDEKVNKEVLTIAKEKHVFMTEPMIPAAVVVFEDAMELLFEYRFVDMYITEADTVVLINATLMAIVQVGLLLLCIKSIYDQFQKSRVNKSWSLFVAYLNFYLHVFFFAIATVTRAFEVWGQTNSKEINPKCLKVEFSRVVRNGRLESDGRLVQKPSEDGCMSKGDELMLAMIGLSMSVGGVSLMAFIYTRWLLYKNKNRPELNMPKLEEQVAERTKIFLNQ